MAEPLKNLYSRKLIESVSRLLKELYNDFNDCGFVTHVIDDEWVDKELKNRMMHISKSLNCFLPMEYSEAVHILMKASQMFDGFQYMFFPGFIELYGLDEYEKSIEALEYLTKYSSSEFAVRPFIKKYNLKMMKQMEVWAESENHHVRRLASEGCRPRLPWAMALPEFKKAPQPIILILEKLKNDESEYVRRSVANNLNDISKDNPQVVIEIARNWIGDSRKTDWIVKHACRTLLKQGHPEIMELFGLSKHDFIKLKDFLVPSFVEIGGNLKFSFLLNAENVELGKTRIEYAIDFVKKNGSFSRKIFKISEAEVKDKNKKVMKSHSFRKISTRKYYKGNHVITIIVNGHEIDSIDFLVK